MRNTVTQATAGRWIRYASVLVLAASTACTGGPFPSPSPLSVALLESGFDACALLDVASVEGVTGRSVSEASEHLTGVPLEDIRDCVFFGPRQGNTMSGIVTVSVRQVATSAAEGEALLADLAQDYPSEEVVGGHLVDGVPALEIRHCDAGNACYSWLAFSAEPYFVIVRIGLDVGDTREAELLAQTVLRRLTGN